MRAGGPDVAVRALGAADVELYRGLRLAALRASPEAFGSSYEEESGRPLERFRADVATVPPDVIFGAFAGEHLVGMAGFVTGKPIKMRHKGTLWGVFVQPSWRERGLGGRLVRRVVEHAATHVAILHGVVVTTNEGARAVYRRLGFTPYGVERQALCIDGAFFDEELLALDLLALGSSKEDQGSALDPPKDSRPLDTF